MEITKQYTKEYLKEKLQENVGQVTFTKKNGEVRIMTCTLIDSYIPQKGLVLTEDGIIPPKKVRTESPDTLSVFDIEKSEWRSFVVESVTDLQITPIEEHNPASMKLDFTLDTDPGIDTSTINSSEVMHFRV